MTDLPPGWAWTTLQDLAAAEHRAMTDGPFGSNLKSSHYVDAGPRVIRLQNIGFGHFVNEKAHISDAHFQKLRAHEALAGDLIVASLGQDLPRVCLVPPSVGPAIVKADCIRVRLHPILNPRYVTYALQRPDLRRAVADQIHGVGRPRLGMAVIKDLEVPVPPRAEQERIVAAIEEHFSRLDAAEHAVRTSRSRLLTFRSSITSEALKGGWPVVPLESHTVDQRYGSSAKASRAGVVPVLRMGNIVDGELDYGNLKYLPAGHPDLVTCDLAPGDLLFNRTNSPELVGKSAVFTGSRGPVSFASYLIRVRVDAELDPRWAATAINSPSGRRYIDSVRTQQVGQANVNGTKLKGFPVPMPPIEVQRERLAHLEQARTWTAAVEAEVRRALARVVSLRRSILAAAFSGQLVPQDPDDEPASALLKRIQAEQAAVTPPKRTRKSKAS